ncbi:MAG: hypothetical protein K8U57_30580 [Planctomycetes bacterium]|nr:hypothetical protein [Planctomycetota bacterium]
MRSRVIGVLQADFDPRIWQAFWAFAVEGRPAADIAKELGVAVDWVYRAARLHVLPRLRRELDGFLD